MAHIQPHLDRLAQKALRLLLWVALPLLVVGASAAPARQATDQLSHYLPMVNFAYYRIAFFSDRDLNREIYEMNADGSGQTNLTNSLSSEDSPAWSPDGRTIAFVSVRDDGRSAIYVMNADGSGLTNLTNYEAADWGPAWSPDGQRIAFVSNRDGSFEIYVMNADGSDQTNLPNDSAYGFYSSRLVWSPDGQRIAFTCRQVESALQMEIPPQGAPPYPPPPPPILNICVVNTDGSGQTNLTNNQNRTASVSAPAWSPDGRIITFAAAWDGNSEIYVMNADGSNQTNLTNDSAYDWGPLWSPDGQRIAFESTRDGNSEIYVMNTDGSDQTNLTNDSAYDWEPLWSPDGQRIAFIRHGIPPFTPPSEIYVMKADGSGLIDLTNNEAGDSQPAWSPTIQ